MATNSGKRSDPKRSQSARVATAARKQARAQKSAQAETRSLEALARKLGVSYR